MSRKLELTPRERAALSRACERYRAQLPAYLASVQSEVRLIRAILRKL